MTAPTETIQKAIKTLQQGEQWRIENNVEAITNTFAFCRHRLLINEQYCACALTAAFCATHAKTVKFVLEVIEPSCPSYYPHPVQSWANKLFGEELAVQIVEHFDRKGDINDVIIYLYTQMPNWNGQYAIPAGELGGGGWRQILADCELQLLAPGKRSVVARDEMRASLEQVYDLMIEDESLEIEIDSDGISSNDETTQKWMARVEAAFDKCDIVLPAQAQQEEE